MSIDTQPALPEDTPPRVPYTASYTAIWNTIAAHKNEPSLDVRVHDTVAPLVADLHLQRQQDPRAIYDIHFHRSLLAAELAPLLVLNEQDFDAMPPEVFQGAIERIREVATFQIRDILHGFKVGMTPNEIDAFDGILHEITPMGVYSQGDTLLLPASDIEDRYHKTDLNAYRKTDTIRHERVQCKRNKSSSPPIPGVVLIDAADYGNRTDPRKRIYRPENTSHLLVEAADGDVSAAEKLAEISQSFWEIADHRLSKEYQEIQQEMFEERMRNLRFRGRIAPEMLAPFMTIDKQ